MTGQGFTSRCTPHKNFRYILPSQSFIMALKERNPERHASRNQKILLHSCCRNNTAITEHTHTQLFHSPFSGTTRVSRYQKKSSSGLYGARGDNRSRHADNPAGCHSIWTNQRPTSLIPTFLRRMPFLLQPSQFILAWDMHLACIPSGLVNTAKYRNKLVIKTRCKYK